MNAARQLHDCLKHELTLANEFLEILTLEQQALLEPVNEQALSDAIAAKNQHIEKLAAAGQQRESVLGKMGLANTVQGLQQAMGQYPELADTLNPLLVTVAKANELNARNGEIIDTFIAHNQQTIDALRNLMGEGTIYDARGRTSSGGKGPRHEVKAG